MLAMRVLRDTVGQQHT